MRHVGLVVMMVVAGLVGPGCRVLRAADGDTAELVRVEAAVDRALEYLASRQDPSGSWPHGLSQQSTTGIDALCVLAFLGRGHVPGRGPYRETVGRAVAGLVASRRPDDLLVRAGGHSHGPMYEHGLEPLALIEASGSVPDPDIRTICQAAVDLIVASQNRKGGWRYQPKPQDADLSVTVMQVVALRAAQNARFHVPEATIEGAIRYVKSCARPEGGFAYQPGQGVKNAQSAAGALSLTLLGRYDDPAVEAALSALQKREYRPQMDDCFHYMNYYAMQAHFQAVSQWAAWNGRVRSFLLDAQATDGSWPGWGEERLNGQAKCYSTALATMALEVYMHYLPAYQR